MANYLNFGHYIAEGWQAEPKESFKAIAAHIGAQELADADNLLDVGCATGELMGFLSANFPALKLTGADVFDELLASGRHLLPAAQFVKASALDLPKEFHERFEIVTAVGVMSIFDESQLLRFWQGLLNATRPGGLVIVLSPLNEFGVDTLIRHRKRCDGTLLDWESGWNVFSLETIREVVASIGQEVVFERFVFKPVLCPREDPVRTWTLPTDSNPYQLTNGLKLLVDHYFMLVRKI